MLRTHNCGELRKTDEKKEVKLAGWINKLRTHGNLTFIDIRDRYGITQITLSGEEAQKAAKLHKEDVIKITGTVTVKPEPNKALLTGEIEIIANKIKVLNQSEPMPIDENATDEMRLKYRYLDIRNNKVIKNLEFRSKIIQLIRNYCTQKEFLEIETPMMVKSTPEGARDYVVPSRVNKGEFYALPQSPQLYKQILMIAGVDKYFQIARCLRDEDLRADRQPEHTQLDFEMSFVEQKDVQKFVQELMKEIFAKGMNKKIEDFPIISYEESMKQYGTDKPDIRYELKLKDMTTWAKTTSFNVFNNAEKVYALYAPKNYSRKQIDKFTETVKTYKAKGLAYIKIKEEKIDGGISKFVEEQKKELLNKLKIDGEKTTEGTIFFVADKKRVAQISLGHLRTELAKDLNLLTQEFRFCFVNDFPLFSYNKEEQKWEPEHHMFSMPKKEYLEDFEKRPGEVIGDLWDLVLNGWEMASGSIRVSNPKIQERIMNFIGIDKKEAHEKFGFLLEAYKYGGPIHGGMGIGIDRLISMMLGLSDIREVIAFPKNKNAQCPMDSSPAKITNQQLEELGIILKKN